MSNRCNQLVLQLGGGRSGTAPGAAYRVRHFWHTPFEAARPQGFTRSLERKQVQAWRERVPKLRAGALIKWKDPRFRRAHETYLNTHANVASERAADALGRGR